MQSNVGSSEGLPVKRVTNRPHSPVVADSEELDAWILHRMQLPRGVPPNLAENCRRAPELCRQAEEIKKEFQARMHTLKKTFAQMNAKLRR